MIVYLNGKFLPEQRAHISIHDRGFLSGDGVYETLRVYTSQVFLLEEHLERLKRSLAGISLVPPVSLKKLGQALEKTVKANRYKGASVRLTITRGPGPHGFDPRVCKTPTVLITPRPFEGYSPALYKRGMSVAVVSVRRNSPEALPPSIKSISCMNNILAKIEANRLKADDALLLSDDGSVAEGTICNVFLAKNGRLFTPALNGRQLAGVTRALVCRLARENGVPVTETRLSPNDLLSADEVFLTSSLMEVMPVGGLIAPSQARRPARLPVVGQVRFKRWPLALQLREAYGRFVENSCGGGHARASK